MRSSALPGELADGGAAPVGRGRTPEGEPTTLIITRKGAGRAGRTCLTFDGGIKTTLVLTDLESGQLTELLEDAGGARRPDEHQWHRNLPESRTMPTRRPDPGGRRSSPRLPGSRRPAVSFADRHGEGPPAPGLAAGGRVVPGGDVPGGDAEQPAGTPNGWTFRRSNPFTSQKLTHGPPALPSPEVPECPGGQRYHRA